MWKLTVESVYILKFKVAPTVQFLDNCAHILGDEGQCCIPSDHVWTLELENE